MKYIFQFLRILAVCLLAEVLQAVLPLPVPSSIYGLVLMLAALKTGLIRLEQIKETAGFLIAVMPLMFVPAAAGVMDMLPEIKAMLLPILIALVPVTVLVMAVGGKVAQVVAEKGEKKNG